MARGRPERTGIAGAGAMTEPSDVTGTLVVRRKAKWDEVGRRHRARTEAKVERRRHRRCFFTQPYGHKYVPVEGTELWSECVGCGKRKWIAIDL